MNLKNLHIENKAVQTNVLFEPTEKVISIQQAVIFLCSSGITPKAQKCRATI